jgi:hypothetical protein
MKRLLTFAAVCVLAAATTLAQRGPIPDPLVLEGATIKLAEHTYVIRDNDVGGVPSVGVVVGGLGTLAIDPCLGRRNGDAVLRETAKARTTDELYVASRHFDPE